MRSAMSPHVMAVAAMTMLLLLLQAAAVAAMPSIISTASFPNSTDATPNTPTQPGPAPSDTPAPSCAFTSFNACIDLIKNKNPVALAVVAAIGVAVLLFGSFIICCAFKLCCFAVKTTGKLAKGAAKAVARAGDAIASSTEGRGDGGRAKKDKKDTWKDERMRPPSPGSTAYHRDRIYGNEPIVASSAAALSYSPEPSSRSREDYKRGGSAAGGGASDGPAPLPSNFRKPPDLPFEKRQVVELTTTSARPVRAKSPPPPKPRAVSPQPPQLQQPVYPTPAAIPAPANPYYANPYGNPYMGYPQAPYPAPMYPPVVPIPQPYYGMPPVPMPSPPQPPQPQVEPAPPPPPKTEEYDDRDDNRRSDAGGDGIGNIARWAETQRLVAERGAFVDAVDPIKEDDDDHGDGSARVESFVGEQTIDRDYGVTVARRLGGSSSSEDDDESGAGGRGSAVGDGRYRGESIFRDYGAETVSRVNGESNRDRQYGSVNVVTVGRGYDDGVTIDRGYGDGVTIDRGYGDAVTVDRNYGEQTVDRNYGDQTTDRGYGRETVDRGYGDAITMDRGDDINRVADDRSLMNEQGDGGSSGGAKGRYDDLYTVDRRGDRSGSVKESDERRIGDRRGVYDDLYTVDRPRLADTKNDNDGAGRRRDDDDGGDERGGRDRRGGGGAAAARAKSRAPPSDRR